MHRIAVNPEMLLWALDRSSSSVKALEARLPRLAGWLSGDNQPTMKQLETFARATHTPVGFLFLQNPPEEKVPIPDFRRMNANNRFGRPSPDLLDTIYACQQRQEWYREYLVTIGEQPLSFVGSADLMDDIVQTAAQMRSMLNFDIEARAATRNWTEALRSFISQADQIGVLVMINGVVGNNSHRKLDPEEFRGFSLADKLAPLVFINGADTKAAQMFTLAHELAHIWLGYGAVSDTQALESSANEVEQWCNQVAAEFLVPMAMLVNIYQADNRMEDEMKRLADHFKVSTLVILRRLYDAGAMTAGEFRETYLQELSRLCSGRPASSGGNFHLTLAVRVGRSFARALVVSTLEGHTLYRDAFQMLGISSQATFRDFSHHLGLP